ncbi:MAG: AI-2E family transporter [Bryobacteraceae bacterium]|jgi:predicted PurR-regulated permease PerM
MLGIDRSAARYTWTAALVVLLLWLVYLVRGTLFIFILALLFAYLISPLVNLIDRFLPGSRTRTLALGLAYVIFVAVMVLIGTQIGSRVVEEATSLKKTFPNMVAGWQPAAGSLQAQVVDKVRAEVAKRSSDLVSELPQLSVRFLAVASNLVYVVLIPILAFFFLKDADLIRQHILDLVEEGPRRALLDDVLADTHLLLAHYMRAMVLLSVGTFAIYSIFFSIMGVPYGILLGVLGGLLEFIPTIGPVVAGLTILVVVVVSGGHVLAVVIFVLCYRVFMDYVAAPRLMGRGVELHPLLLLFGVFAGAEVAGIAGAFLSVPVLAMVRILYRRMRKARLSGRLVSTGAAAP